ncbi:MAG: DNA-protecting protein DprA [Ignavibacteriales bacterium]|nr:DNA-protecting protein DprA [Ignavibacteriales bacterium]
MISITDLLTLSQIPGIGAGRIRSLVSHFGDTQSITNSSVREIAACDGFSKKLASVIVHFNRSQQFTLAMKYAEKQLSRLNKSEGKIVSFWDQLYPELLKKIYDPPTILFYKGTLHETDKYSIAIVGTRNPSEYGFSMAEKISDEIAKLGITIVSGLARGIDTVVHSAAVKTNGRTFAVIGSGIDVIYPPENRTLFERIIKSGAVISEYEMGAKPDAVNFPKRNRIISGLSLGTIVIETDIGGGAMITANTALDQNREVFALPGNINSKKSKGCNLLIKEGRAKLVESVEDVLTELTNVLKPILKKPSALHSKPLPSLTDQEKNILNILTESPIHIDALAESARISTSDLLVNLLSLEFKGLVKQLAGKNFIKAI